jgi:hypothetical protein
MSSNERTITYGGLIGALLLTIAFVVAGLRGWL